MNDLEYRRKQLLKLQDAVIDLEDLSTGVSIADLTLTDFRIDLAEYRREHPNALDALPLGVSGVTTSRDADIEPGVIFCLRAEGPAAARAAEPGYSLAPYYLVHVGQDGTVLLPYSQTKQILDRLKRLCVGRDLPDADACARFDKDTRDGKDMRGPQQLLATAVASVVGKTEERAISSLFTPGGTHAMKGEFAGNEDFEVAARRELLEETGYAADRFEELLRGPSSAGLSDEQLVFYRAHGLRKEGPGGGDASEDIRVHEVPLDSLRSWLDAQRAKGRLVEPKIFAALFAAGIQAT